MAHSDVKITEGTLVPIGLVALTVGLLVGLAIDYTNLKADVRVAKTTQESYSSDMQDIKEDLAAIRGKLGLPLRRK